MKKSFFLFSILILLFSGSVSYAEKRQEYLKYWNESVKLDIYDPGFSGCAVVILLHGSAGIEGDRATRYESFATDLMEKGIMAINVHYFDSAQVNWTNTILQTINYVNKIPNADPKRIGLVGYSLGGTLALGAASIDNRVKLLVLNAPYLPVGFSKESAAALPKTLIISGDQDQAINSLETLTGWLGELGKPFWTKINKGFGHDNIPLDVFQEDWDAAVRFFGNL